MILLKCKTMTTISCLCMSSQLFKLLIKLLMQLLVCFQIWSLETHLPINQSVCVQLQLQLFIFLLFVLRSSNSDDYLQSNNLPFKQFGKAQKMMSWLFKFLIRTHCNVRKKKEKKKKEAATNLSGEKKKKNVDFSQSGSSLVTISRCLKVPCLSALTTLWQYKQHGSCWDTVIIHRETSPVPTWSEMPLREEEVIIPKQHKITVCKCGQGQKKTLFLETCP